MDLAHEFPPYDPADTRLAVAILRAGLVACYVGHGALGLFLCAPAAGAWPAYFGVVGIGRDTALHLMPWVGAFDIAMAISVIVYPVRSVMLYMTLWCGWTALLRPLAGESFWEAVERAGNYGVPLALVLIAGGTWWRRVVFPTDWDESRRQLLHWTLRLTTVFVLFGHGALNLIVRKPLFVSHYHTIGLPGTPTELIVGGFECLLALVILFRPERWLLVVALVWKLLSEALAPMAGSPLWVFIEHGGSYAAPLALAMLTRSRHVAAFSRPLSPA